jgi:oxygen-independent coproporphyrinogen III oxidase
MSELPRVPRATRGWGFCGRMGNFWVLARMGVMSRMALLPQTSFAALPAGLGGVGAAIESVYVHVPFCTSKCHYCDFYSVAGHLDLAADYLAALERELDLHRQFFGPLRPRTMFIGGGTPTLLPPALLSRLMKILRNGIDLSRVEEFSIEANPNTFDGEKAAVLAAGRGVNRISFGAQSFHAAELRMLQRDHDPESVSVAFAAARAAGVTNLNVDLIFGIPGQTLASWDQSLSRALDLDAAHMSCYSLIYEPNTPLTARMRAGEFPRLDEELELAFFEHVYARLRGAGFTRYETSNYARTAPCRHNLVYWKAGNWLGLGPSAGSHVALAQDGGAGGDDEPAAWQWKNAGSLAHYLEALRPGFTVLPITQMEALGRRKWAAGAAVFWLRLHEGLNYAEFLARTGLDVRPVLEKTLKAFVELGFAEVAPEAARITERGVAVSDHILKRVLAAIEEGRAAS